MSSIPSELRYTDAHQWARREPDGRVTVGITDYAQDALGDVVFIDLPAEGKTVTKDRAMFVVESVKAASDVFAPVSGTIAEVNSALQNEPESLNAKPYEAWIVRISPTHPEEYDTLMAAEAYSAITADGA
ncbi:MAG: glycine cleavage system protein GcvH [Pseudomonadota bacterium]|jgi:glycine cleavage system H protein